MHKMQTRKRMIWVGAALLAITSMVAGTASAHDHDRYERSHRRSASRHDNVERHQTWGLRQSVAIIDPQLDLVAAIAAVAGDYPLAYALGQRGYRSARHGYGYSVKDRHYAGRGHRSHRGHANRHHRRHGRDDEHGERRRRHD